MIKGTNPPLITKEALDKYFKIQISKLPINSQKYLIEKPTKI